MYRKLTEFGKSFLWLLGALRDVIYNNITLSASVWYSFIITFNGITGSFYINKVEGATNTDNRSYTAMENGIGDVLFGKDNRYATASLDGFIDEISFFNKELTIIEAYSIIEKNESGLYLTE